MLEFLLTKLDSIWYGLRCSFKSRVLKTKCVFDLTTNFMAEAKIFNMSNIKESIIIGQYTTIRGELVVYAHGGKIDIGEYCYVGENSRIWSAQNIKIGNRVLIAHNVDIHDSNDHPLDPQKRHEHYIKIIKEGHPSSVDMDSAPIIIEDDVWIGFKASIMKGVTIAQGAVVAAGTVVTKNVEAYTIVAGIPAQIVGFVKKT